MDPNYQQEIQKRRAITAIQKQLMQIENTQFSTGSPPAYSMHNQQQMANNFPPPPQYQQRRLQPQVPLNAQGSPRLPNMGQTGAMRMQYQQTKHLQNLAEKERLLQQQKVQQIVVPVNATTSGGCYLNLKPFYLKPFYSN